MEDSLRISLKAARVNAKLTQREAAKQIGVCVDTLRNYESGNSVPDWNVVYQIERVYGIRAENIFFDTNSA